MKPYNSHKHVREEQKEEKGSIDQKTFKVTWQSEIIVESICRTGHKGYTINILDHKGSVAPQFHIRLVRIRLDKIRV